MGDSWAVQLRFSVGCIGNDLPMASDCRLIISHSLCKLPSPDVSSGNSISPGVIHFWIIDSFNVLDCLVNLFSITSIVGPGNSVWLGWQPCDTIIAVTHFSMLLQLQPTSLLTSQYTEYGQYLLFCMHLKTRCRTNIRLKMRRIKCGYDVTFSFWQVIW